MNATLSRSVDTRRAQPGDEVTAKLAQDVESGGHVLHRGTTLVGHVTEARPHDRRAENGGDSRLGIVFDRAVLSDGREIPVNATIQAVAATEGAASSGAGGFESGATGVAGAATSGRASGGGLGGGLAGGVTGAAGGALGTAGSIGGNVGGAARGTLGGAASASAGAVGGLNAAGRLASGSRGTFGMRGVDITSAAAGSAQGSVLTSRTGNVELGRGSQMLLVAGGHAAASAQGAGAANVGSAAGQAAGSAAASGSATGSATGVSRTRGQSN